MAKKKRKLPELSDGQMEVMDAVWQLGRCTVGDVFKALQMRRPVARNTIHTLMTRLTEKGWLKVSDCHDGRNLYEATASREMAQQQSVRAIVDTVFQGSAEGLVLTLLDSGQVSDLELTRIQKMINQAKRRKE